MSPTAIFDLYFDEEVINYLTKMTNLYAHRDRGKHNFHVEHSEMRLFLAMLLLSGYNVLTRRRMYWENSEDVKNDSMSRAMSRNRFEEILSVLHCCDNNNLQTEEKVRKENAKKKKKYAKPASNGRPRGRILSATQRVSIDVRLDRVDHYQSALPTQRRCGVCRKNTKKGCKKCGCGLHDHCFEEWHEIN